MPGGEQHVRRAWRAAMVAAGCGDRRPLEQTTFDAVLGHYREPHRRYHGVDHVAAVVRHVDEICHCGEVALPPPTTAAVVAAALFHDAVYEPLSASNEADSAALAHRTLAEIGWPTHLCDAVSWLVMATAHTTADGGPAPPMEHGETADEWHTARAVLLDADLAILGAEPSAYAAYERGVRAEYAAVDDDRWRTGRAGVLRSLLQLDHVYRTTTMRSAREHRARANMTAELASLGAAQR